MLKIFKKFPLVFFCTLCICIFYGNLVHCAEIYIDYSSMARKMEKLNREKKYQQVIDKYERYATESNKNYSFFNYLGVAHAKVEISRLDAKKNGNWKKAEKYLLRAHELNNKNPAVMLNLATLYTWTKDYMSACRFARMYLENNGLDKKTANTILEKYKPNIIEKKVRLEKGGDGKYIFVDE